MTTEKFCTRCGKKFNAVGREVICPSCKAQAAEETKKAAVLRAKRASWTGESVPVRISGRASTLIRKFGEGNNLPFAESLDELIKATAFFKSMNAAWEDITPYKSHRRDRCDETVQGKQDATSKATGKQQAAKKAASTSKAAGKE